MLINDEYAVHALDDDPLSQMIARLGRPNDARTPGTIRLRTGIYQTSGFGSSAEMPGYDHYPMDLELNSYGVCDNVDQIIEQCPTLQDPVRQFVILVREVRRADQTSNGGWRWHKWGPYIGIFEHQHEYLYDEIGIDRVLIYSIFEKQ